MSLLGILIIKSSLSHHVLISYKSILVIKSGMSHNVLISYKGILVIKLGLSHNVLISYKGILVIKSGLSSKSQELTALFLIVKLVSGTILRIDFYSILEFITLVSTVWVIYMIRFKLKNTYVKSLDNFHLYYVVIFTVTYQFTFLDLFVI